MYLLVRQNSYAFESPSQIARLGFAFLGRPTAKVLLCGPVERFANLSSMCSLQILHSTTSISKVRRVPVSFFLENGIRCPYHTCRLRPASCNLLRLRLSQDTAEVSRGCTMPIFAHRDCISCSTIPHDVTYSYSHAMFH